MTLAHCENHSRQPCVQRWPALLNTSRQIRAEAQPVLEGMHKSGPIHLLLADKYEELEPVDRQLLASVAARVHAVTLQHQYVNFIRISQFPGLERITLDGRNPPRRNRIRTSALGLWFRVDEDLDGIWREVYERTFRGTNARLKASLREVSRLSVSVVPQAKLIQSITWVPVGHDMSPYQRTPGRKEVPSDWTATIEIDLRRNSSPSSADNPDPARIMLHFCTVEGEIVQILPLAVFHSVDTVFDRAERAGLFDHTSSTHHCYLNVTTSRVDTEHSQLDHSVDAYQVFLAKLHGIWQRQQHRGFNIYLTPTS